MKIHTRKEPDGWRSYVTDGEKVIVVDSFFDNESEAITEAIPLL